MAGSMNRPITNTSESSSSPSPSEAAVDIDMDAIDAEESEQLLDEEHLAFKKPTDVRRRLEERLEVRRLKDQLGVDDLDF